MILTLLCALVVANGIRSEAMPATLVARSDSGSLRTPSPQGRAWPSATRPALPATQSDPAQAERQAGSSRPGAATGSAREGGRASETITVANQAAASSSLDAIAASALAGTQMHVTSGSSHASAQTSAASAQAQHTGAVTLPAAPPVSGFSAGTSPGSSGSAPGGPGQGDAGHDHENGARGGPGASDQSNGQQPAPGDNPDDDADPDRGEADLILRDPELPSVPLLDPEG
ncbi:hypothetical protein [Nocardioides acrostichi]|uniref:Uncharacterized protein n=1 Tax=Nocardioides acrostichi TaxID=2784339 RepID=A0A930UYF3_9ACTN|nr:hypothetical protein [Nocardioides acrostichi]MBF4160305.1 hypothetical protein [Nocardioides acrostichi]